MSSVNVNGCPKFFEFLYSFKISIILCLIGIPCQILELDPVVLYSTMEECQKVAEAKMQEVKTGFEAQNFVITEIHSFCEAVVDKNNL